MRFRRLLLAGLLLCLPITGAAAPLSSSPSKTLDEIDTALEREQWQIALQLLSDNAPRHAKRVSLMLDRAEKLMQPTSTLSTTDKQKLAAMMTDWLYQSGLSTHVIADATLTIADYHANHNQIVVALKVILKTLRLLEGRGTDAAETTLARYQLHHQAGHLYTDIEQHASAYNHYTKAQHHARIMSNTNKVRETYYYAGKSLTALRQFIAALQAFTKAATLAPEGDVDPLAYQTLSMLAYTHFSIGEFAPAKTYALKAWEAYQNDRFSPSRQDLHAGIIAVGYATFGHEKIARQWDEKHDLSTNSWLIEEALLRVWLKRFEQRKERMPILVANTALYKRYFANFEERLDDARMRDLISHETTHSMEREDAARMRDNMTLSMSKKKRYYQVFLTVVLFSSLLLGVGVCLFFIREARHRSTYAYHQDRDSTVPDAYRRCIMLEYGELRLKQSHRESPNGLGVALLNIDGLKSINSRYGSDVGDQVLRHVFDCVTPLLRDQDRLGRYSGDEFLLLMVNASEQDMRMMFDSIQQALQTTPLVLASAEEPTITLSMGATRFVPSPLKKKAVPPLTNLISMADDHIYLAKTQGGDQIVFA